jgi:hypothetical protein
MAHSASRAGQVTQVFALGEKRRSMSSKKGIKVNVKAEQLLVNSRNSEE